MKPHLANWPARHPGLALGFAFVAALLAAVSTSRLQPDTSFQSLFSPNDPAANALNRVLNHFPAAEEMLVLATTPGTAPKPEQLIEFADRLKQKIDRDPQTSKLIAAIHYRADARTRDFVTKVIVPNGLFYLSDSEFHAATRRLTKPEMTGQFQRNEAMLAAPGPAAGALAKALLQDPLRLHEFIEQRLMASRPFKTYENSDAFMSEDGRSLLIRISGAKPPSDMEFCRQITAGISTLAQNVNTDHLALEFSGAYPIAAQSERAIRGDSIASVLGSVVCLAGLFMLTFRRSFRLIAVTFTPVALGVLYGFGIYALFSRNVTPLTGVIGAVLAGVGIDYSVFYLVHYLERRTAGASPADAADATLHTIGGALVAAWVTSVVGFIAIVFASIRALRDFSIVGSLGLAGALFGAVFILPALLVLMDRWGSRLLTMTRTSSPWWGAGAKRILFFGNFFSSISPTRAGSPCHDDIKNRNDSSPFRVSIRPLLRWIDIHAIRCNCTSMAILLTIVAGLAIAGPQLGMESDPSVLHPRPNPPLDAQIHIAQRMGSAPDSLIVHLQAETADGLLTLAHRVSERLSSIAARNAGVASTFGLASLLPNPAMVPDRLRQVGPALAEAVLADFDAVVAESSFNPKAYEPYRNFLKILLTPAVAPGIAEMIPYTQLAETFLPRQTMDGVAPTEAITLVFLRQALDQRTAREATVTTLRSLLHDLPGATLTGMAVLSLDTEATIHRDLPRLILAAVLIVAVYLLLHFRSITDALLAVLPTLCSLACLLSIAKMTGAKMNLANIVSIPLLIGIDVDYGIFLVSVARRTRTRAELLDRVSASSLAVILCAAATLLGFGSLAFTSVPAIRSLGWAVGIGVTSCAIASLFFLLPLLLWMKDRAIVKSSRTIRSTVAQASLIVFALSVIGCSPPSGRLTFPTSPVATTADTEWFDIHHGGQKEFGIARDTTGRVDRLLYADHRDGNITREYRLGDYASQHVPHLILLLDSLPFETVDERYQSGDLHWFDPPVKMIAPFPSFTEICFSDVLHAPPLPGVTDRYFDPRDEQRKGILWERVKGFSQPWERRLHYHPNYMQQGLSFLHPDEWFAAELEQARLALDRSPDRVTLVYIGSAASMVCKYGKAGAERVLDGARQLCLQLLYERRGAIKISMMADHGHNYTPSKNVSIENLLTAGGFHCVDRICGDKDCVLEINALVTSAGITTRLPAEVAALLCKHEAVELAIYSEGARAIIQSARGIAAIECRAGKLRYIPINADVLEYDPLIEKLKAEGEMTPDGFASEDVWFQRTLDHLWPNAPRRIWDALHGRFINPPTVMLSIRDGYYAGDPEFEKYIKMASTHGGLNQINSATFVMTMTGRLTKAVRHEDVIGIIEPGYEPRVQR